METKRQVHLNNFDLLRLLAASQVVYLHCIKNMDLPTAAGMAHWVYQVLRLFPGVPIFFVASGFLISISCEKSRGGITSYFRNRFLRLYPALWVCFGLSLVMLLLAGFLSWSFLTSKSGMFWIAGQLTFVQYFNPSHLRDFGVGVLNGSLWTIPVELQFYVLLPILYRVLRLRSTSRTGGNLALLALAALSAGLYLFVTPRNSFTCKCITVSILPHLWMFLLGVLIQRNFDKLKTILEGKFLFWLPVFLGLEMLVRNQSLAYAFYLLPVARTAMACMVVSAAFSAKGLSSKLLRGHDISYGVYLYHMIVMNACLYLGFQANYSTALIVFVGAYALGILSWISVEKPSLALKNRFQLPARNPLTRAAVLD
jgi:peptidoglycan/LPS O-acetylase OafA/YrhL